MPFIQDTGASSRFKRTTSETPMRVAFLGPRGTYSHQIAFNHFGHDVEYVQKETISDAFHAVPSEASIAVIPAENSIFGAVIESLDLLRLPEVGKTKFIRGEVTLQVQHCLLVAQGTKLGDVKQVLSHEQALGQCNSYLKEHLPEAVVTKTPSTAAAAEAILTEPLRQVAAAICSEVCTVVYPGLELLEKGIQSEKNNFTKFWITADSSSLVPDVESEESRALLRISSDSEKAIGLAPVITELNLVVRHINRRPSIQCTPFHDVYILEVSKLPHTSTRTNSGEQIHSWVDEVEAALGRVRDLGWEGGCLGTW
ncbi:PDT-domain-containing protein [Fomitiporia mediterranea MF3/22]|uniref:PDT-domain-containing protein n=1 Tax=Fomitiporia mediterranea (strain MF3/22) TaxID=694068 RepID=UPI00044086A0|nr:PDT-domain-containing protein [Fomitiporia mediterranea MF3/22]EJD03966.1 PDT-domain-containing protein [Fomitiporia mediterranea MF3/22]